MTGEFQVQRASNAEKVPFDDVIMQFKCVFVNENYRILIQISMELVPGVQLIIWHPTMDKPVIRTEAYWYHIGGGVLKT